MATVWQLSGNTWAIVAPETDDSCPVLPRVHPEKRDSVGDDAASRTMANIENELAVELSSDLDLSIGFNAKVDGLRRQFRLSQTFPIREIEQCDLGT
uniref:Uncharacterized protein n=1 Tax=Caenorhabditis japonica TaxID=281687 RepID=A0A8R1IF80_CAEJA